MGPAAGERMITAGGNTTRYIVNLPAGYEMNTPQPLGFAFHGFGNNVCTGECVGFRDMKAVTVFPKSVTAGWEGNALASNIAVFEALVALMKTDYCIDENRIFVAGTSSGGQFTEHLACRFGDWLWQVSPVAAFVDNGANTNCKGTPPALIVHGITDNAGMMGQTVAEMFAKRNGCAATPPAGLAQARTEMMAAFNARRAEHRCMDWDGCTANPVRYCLSSQITYSGLTHGWPRVGAMLISEFQAELKNSGPGRPAGVRNPSGTRPCRQVMVLGAPGRDAGRDVGRRAGSQPLARRDQCGVAPGSSACRPLCQNPMTWVWPAARQPKKRVQARANSWPAAVPKVSQVRNHHRPSAPGSRRGAHAGQRWLQRVARRQRACDPAPRRR